MYANRSVLVVSSAVLADRPLPFAKGGSFAVRQEQNATLRVAVGLHPKPPTPWVLRSSMPGDTPEVRQSEAAGTALLRVRGGRNSSFLRYAQKSVKKQPKSASAQGIRRFFTLGELTGGSSCKELLMRTPRVGDLGNCFQFLGMLGPSFGPPLLTLEDTLKWPLRAG
jgi:hypothetical protein